MNRFSSLVSATESRWRAGGENLADFPTIATEVLREFDYTWTQQQLDNELAQWLLDGAELPAQVNVHNSFGQPPLTLFNNGKFVVDLYLWVNFDTSLHSHGFRGAFRVLHGKSLHEEYLAKTVKQFEKDIALTRLGRPKTSILQPTDVRTILPGQELTHRVIHLHNPTVTLCVKTINEPDLFQWNYFGAGLAIQKRVVSAALIKSIYYFQYLLGQNTDSAADFLDQLLTKLDSSLQMNLYEEIAAGGLDLNEEATHAVLESITARHESSEWFKLYEESGLAALTELEFSHVSSPTARLLAHAINSGYNFDESLALLKQLAGRDFPESEMQNEVLSLAAEPGLFHFDFQDAEIKEIQRLILNREAEIPSHLPSAQIQTMRRFTARSSY